MFFFFSLSKHFFYSLNLLGVKEKVLGIEPRKILRPDPGLYSQYFPSYDIFGEPKILDTQFSTWFCTKIKIWLSQKMAELGKYCEYRPGSGLKIFCESIPKTFPLTPKRISEQNKCFRRAEKTRILFLVHPL